MKGFTLVELLIVIAIISLLSSSVVAATNPTKRFAQARDAQRKQDIGQLANLLIEYQVTNGEFPHENRCDSSIGRSNPAECPINPPQNDWSTENLSYIYQRLVGESFAKKLPVDPINNTNYHYRYEPRNDNQSPCTGTGLYCRFWIGGRLEEPNDPARPVFRCTDIDSATYKEGCDEVANFYE